MSDLDNSRNDGGPAFPQTEQSAAINPEGMSLRDYFAGKALEGFAVARPGAAPNPNNWDWEAIASSAYKAADAMLKERSK